MKEYIIQTHEHDAYGKEGWAAPHSQHGFCLQARQLIITSRHNDAYKRDGTGGGGSKLHQ